MVLKRKLLSLLRTRLTFARLLHSRKQIEQTEALGSTHSPAYVWGAGDGGQLGTGTEPINTTPNAFPVKQKVFHIGCGFGFTAVSVASKCQLWISGLDVFSLLGKLPTSSSQGVVSLPQSVDIPVTSHNTCITQIACGRSHALVLTDNEGVFSIGGNSQGQCGLSFPTDSIKMFEPVPLPDDVGRVIKVVCGLDHSLLLSDDGRVFSCGWGADGQTGLGHFNDVAKVTQLKGELEGVSIQDLESSVDCCLAVSDKGEVFSWGNSEYSQLGINTVEQQISVPRRAPLLEDLGKVDKVAAAGSFCVVLLGDGSIYTWGYGVLGHGSDVMFSKGPIRIQGLDHVGEGITGIHCGLDHSAFTTESGRLFVWGRGGFGRLGLGCVDDQWTPKQVELPGPVQEVSCGVDHMGVILKTNR